MSNTTGSLLFFPQLARRSKYPTKQDGSHFRYSAYRAHVREDCQLRCTYCDSHEDEVGGADCMQLDHFRPESQFAPLIDNPMNLHYACGRCNLLKSDHWPAGTSADTHDGTYGFIDPFEQDRREYFKVTNNGVLSSSKPPAEYLVRLLKLNREHLRKLREKRLLISELREYLSKEKRQAEENLVAGRSTDTARHLELCELVDHILSFFAYG